MKLLLEWLDNITKLRNSRELCNMAGVPTIKTYSYAYFILNTHRS